MSSENDSKRQIDAAISHIASWKNWENFFFKEPCVHYGPYAQLNNIYRIWIDSLIFYVRYHIIMNDDLQLSYLSRFSSWKFLWNINIRAQA